MVYKTGKSALNKVKGRPSRAKAKRNFGRFDSTKKYHVKSRQEEEDDFLDRMEVIEGWKINTKR